MLIKISKYSVYFYKNLCDTVIKPYFALKIYFFKISMFN